MRSEVEENMKKKLKFKHKHQLDTLEIIVNGTNNNHVLSLSNELRRIVLSNVNWSEGDAETRIAR